MDRRIKYVTLTSKGKRFLDKLDNTENSLVALSKTLDERQERLHTRLEKIAEYGDQLSNRFNKQISRFNDLDKHNKQVNELRFKERETLLERLNKLDAQIKKLIDEEDGDRFLGVF